MVSYVNECDTANNITWTMDNDSLNDIVHSYVKQYIGDQDYKLNAIIPIITTYAADRDCAWYKAVEIVEEGDEWEYGIGEVEAAGIKELRHNSEDDEFGIVYCELFAEREEKEDMISIALGASHDTDVGTITAYWFIKVYHNNSLIESTKGDIAIDHYLADEKVEIFKLKKDDMDSTHILVGMKLSAHDLCYPSIKYAFNTPN